MDHYQVTAEAFNQLAQAYQSKFMDLDLYNDTYDAFCNLLQTPAAKILEVGCGPGNITNYLLAQHPSYQILGIDVAPAMVELAQTNNPTASFQVMDCRDLASLTLGFDGILCGFIMPYLSKDDCRNLVKDSASLLPSGGVFYGSVIEGNYQDSGFEWSSNGQAKAYVYYHQQNFLLSCLAENNLELVYSTRKQYQKSEGVVSTHLIFMGRKKIENRKPYPNM